MHGDLIPAGAREAAGAAEGIPRPASLTILSCAVGADQLLGAVLGSARLDAGTAIAAFPDVRKGFCRLLAERLSAECGISVSELTGLQAHTPGSPVLVPAQCSARWSEAAPGGFVRVEPVETATPEQTARLRDACASAVGVFGGSIRLLVLSGMASNDVVDAARLVKNSGGSVSVQDESTSLIWDAPRAVLQAGLADEVLPLWDVGSLLAAAAQG